MATTTIPNVSESRSCHPATRTTKLLLGFGAIVGPAYVAVALAQAVTRPEFDLSRHPWSMLAIGEHGWIQVANLVVAGLMTVALAVGLRRALTPGAGAGWGPRLVAVFGASLVAAGVFRAAPALGFPVGAPEGPGEVSWHGLIHFAAGGVGFTCLAVACFIIARRYSAEGRRGWATFSRVVGVVFLAGFATMASSAGGAAGTLSFTGAVVLVWVWVSAVSVDRYRRADQPSLTTTTR